ncbi:uncharacterized protein LOC110377915 [Helicoverpa armigera]|uniref:uncharacterized protein LOC110377915 n=1 Tax=Helicoverpa armigera TaxID=29058 RepID=UPI003082D89A
MDPKDKRKPLNYREHIASRYYESHAGHLFVNNVNPFHTVGGQTCDAKEQTNSKRKNEEFDYHDNRQFDYHDNRQTQELTASPSREIVNDILKNYPFNGNVIVNDEYNEIHEAFLAGHPRTVSQPMVSMSTNVFNTEYVSCSRDVNKTSQYDHKVRFGEYDQQNNNQRALSNDEIMTEPPPDGNKRCEKTTYCRPLLNMYNQQFIYKTMQRNARLQTLVRKLVIAREREKRREAWNNYINDLKNKHRYYSNEPNTISPQYVPGDYNPPATIDDFYNVRSHWPQSNPCQHLLDDLYGGYTPTSALRGYLCDYDASVPDVRMFAYENNRICYPTSSQACMLKWNKERLSQGYSYEFGSRPRYYRGNTIVIENDQKYSFDKLQGTTRPYPIHPLSPTIRTPSPPSNSMTQSQTDETIKPGNPTPSARHENEKILPDVKEELEFTTEIKPEPSPDEAGIYYPFNKGTNTMDRDVVTPLQQKQLQDYVKPTPSKDKKKVNPPKFDKDEGSKKLEDFKNKMVEKFRNKQKEPSNEYELKQSDSFKEKFKKVTDNISRLKEKMRQNDEDTKLRTLNTIEAKIDGIMKSINSIMSEIKVKKNKILLSRKTTAVSRCTTTVTNSLNDLNRHRSDPYGFIKNEEHLVGVVHSSSRSVAITEVGPSDLRRHRDSSTSRILLEEMKKSDKVKRDIEELLKLRNEKHDCSVNITFDIPTRDRSTEVTNSLSKAKFKSVSATVITDIPLSSRMNQEHQQMTIAVNTDPLGFLALLRVSTETVKQLLSYVPHLNSISYQSLLPLPSAQGVSHYICNICGAAFGRPSELSDHIEKHNLGKTRDCCVCRHSLDLRHARPGLFTCQCCGQRFTRAYCCELHQQSCAKQQGMPRDVPSGNVLLR